MRYFVLFARKARTDPDFNIEDLPGSGGRMDLVARCITAALWLSHAIRPDVKFYAVLNGPPRPPVTVLFEGGKLQKLSTDERTTALWIKKALTQNFGKEWYEFRPGIKIAAQSFQGVVKELKENPIYILHERGKPIDQIELKQNPVFILGDHIGIPRADEKFALRFAEAKISLGKQVYLASSCISIINWICDRRGI